MSRLPNNRYDRAPDIQISEQSLSFTSNTQQLPLDFFQPGGSIFRIELLSVLINGVQAVDAGFDWSLRISPFVATTNGSYKLIQFAPTFGINAGSERITGTKDISIPFTASPITYVEFEKPKLLHNDQNFQSVNMVLTPSIVSSLDGTTQPYYTSATLRMKFYYTRDVSNLPLNTQSNIDWVLEKLRY